MILEGVAGRHRIFLRSETIGQDTVVFVYGGNVHHIGGVSVAFPSKSQYRNVNTVSVSTLSFPGHKDYVLASMLAERLCTSLKRSFVVCVGIHINNASKTEIDTAVEISCRLVDEFIAHLQQQDSS